MKKVFRLLAISVAFATLSIAWAQTYKTVNFPGATATLLIGGPNPQGTSVGIEITAGFQHGFILTAGGDFTVIDPPGSTLTSPNYIDAENVVVGNFLDASVTGEHGRVHRPYDALCLEPQAYPDAPNRPDFPPVRLDPGQSYRRHSIYRFSTL